MALPTILRKAPEFRNASTVFLNYPHHVVKRGHNKQVVFAEEADFRNYLRTLEEFKGLYGVKVAK